MKKKLIILLVAIVLTMPLIGCNNREDSVYKEGDFLLEISIDKMAASIGDEIEISLTLKNVSGQDIVFWFNTFKFLGFLGGNIKDMIFTLVHPEGMDYNWGSLHDTLEFSLLPRTTQVGTTKKKLKKDTSIEITKTNKIYGYKEVYGEADMYYYDAYAGIAFYPTKDKKEKIRIKSNIIKIKIYRHRGTE